MSEITQRIQQEAKRLLEGGAIDLVIGYTERDKGSATPCVVKRASDAERLVFDERCTHNLANYLVGREGYLTSRFCAPDARPRVAVVAHPATLRTIIGLIKENQFKRENVFILGISDGIAVGIEPDIVVGETEPNQEAQDSIRAEVGRVERLTADERWALWEQEFSKCIRCYACRQVCPFCYCEQCIAEENQPQWVNRSATSTNNRSWNIIRAFHLVGRCTGCGECDRVCPVDIPLSLLNAKMAAEVQAAFGYVAGADMEEPLPLVSFTVDDPEGAFR